MTKATPKPRVPRLRARRTSPPPDTLSPKQLAFVAEYLVDLNATQAAIRAGYSRTRADMQGYENLRKPEIAAAIQAGQRAQLAAAGVSKARLLQELGRIALSQVADYFDPVTKDAKHPADLSPDAGAALAGFEVLIKNAAAGDGVTDTIHKFKLWDKVKAIELYMKHYGMLIEKVEITDAGVEARVARLEAARKRVDR
jgi:phage terminase small subunit